jgi:hypothetical protein
MDPSEALPRLLQLRGMVARAAPPDAADLQAQDAYGLIESYNRLRQAVRDFAVKSGATEEEFDRDFPRIDSVSEAFPAPAPRILMDYGSKARNAAVAIRQLAGYVEGMIEALVIEQQLDRAQIEAAREASRQPPGFR